MFTGYVIQNAKRSQSEYDQMVPSGEGTDEGVREDKHVKRPKVEEQRWNESLEDEESEGLNTVLECSLERVRIPREAISQREKLLVIGICCVDIVDKLDKFPEEDSETSVKVRTRRLGGNAANLVRVASQFDGLSSTLMYATVPDSSDANARFVRETLHKSKISDLSIMTGGNNGSLPTSYIIQCNETRTILHHRNLPEISFEDFQSVHIPFGYSWVHFEGRNIEETFSIMQSLCGTATISLEVEKIRGDGDILSLTRFADLIIFSKDYISKQGDDEKGFIVKFLDTHGASLRPNVKIVATAGSRGAFGVCFNQGKGYEIFHHKAHTVPGKKIVDTIGAGDTFQAGLIVSLMKGHDLKESVQRANVLAGIKITRQGINELCCVW
eukprot:CAMPEP_0203744476 /NCGR_PEP_ID=MMETSP0098-20131031/524_1 /ASSEMBLY_ACC=CAM_ASM_000208 /TAXON_ID=96639 /ORGANISM=" , Strain NY0313808BC1" /LENGTH=383 /DNA_ID=CAMNT_0050631995 /DNA_START=168 /DNA_END=1316 /DNA_ORIENTATION=-